MVREFSMCVTKEILVDIRHLSLSIVVVDRQVVIQRKKGRKEIDFRHSKHSARESGVLILGQWSSFEIAKTTRKRRCYFKFVRDTFCLPFFSRKAQLRLQRDAKTKKKGSKN